MYKQKSKQQHSADAPANFLRARTQRGYYQQGYVIATPWNNIKRDYSISFKDPNKMWIASIQWVALNSLFWVTRDVFSNIDIRGVHSIDATH